MARAGQPTSPRTCWGDPRRHITAERRSEKLTRHRSRPMTAEYGIASFAARREARRLNVTRAVGPKPLDAAKTRGVKEATSTSRTRWSYRRRLCCSWRRTTEVVERRASFERARPTHTHTLATAYLKYRLCRLSCLPFVWHPPFFIVTHTLGSGLVLAAITCLGRPHRSWEFVLILAEPRWTGGDCDS